MINQTGFSAAKVRPAAFAGQFYPATKDELTAQVKDFLNQADVQTDSFPQVILVPHAGYIYSGPTAAFAYKVINPQTKTVILLGSSHTSHFSGALADSHSFWQTPLGQVPLNQQLINQLNLPSDTSIHQHEHSLEVQLPFLQTVLPDFSIAPIILGQADNNYLKDLAAKIKPILNQQTLLVVSSDLSHYHPQNTAQKIDRQTVNAILENHFDYFNQNPNSACASPAIKLALLLQPSSAQLLYLSNSGIATGDFSQVVGYASLAFFADPNDQLLLDWAHKVLSAFVGHQEIPNQPPPNPALAQKSGVFVTLKKNGQLRGCIGQLEANQSLWYQVKTAALAAATKDPRFPPLTSPELPHLTIEISVLSPLKKINSLGQINLGTHGVYLKQGNITGTFLPQVALETNWSTEEFLNQLCSQKMGLPSDCYLNRNTQIYIYTVRLIN